MTECKEFAVSVDPTKFELGNLFQINDGIRLSKGLTARIIATSGEKIPFTSIQSETSQSSIPFHADSDGAAVFPLDGSFGGYVYVSNSEAPSGGGGVYAIEFDDHRHIFFVS